MHGTYDRGRTADWAFVDLDSECRGVLAAATRASRLPTSISAASATTTSTIRIEQRYREYYALPGAELNEVSGRNFGKSAVEWNLPPVHFRRAGTPGLYLTWMRPALFASGLVTNLDAAGIRRTVGDIGGQLDFRLHMLSTLDLTLSVGGAVAYERGAAPRREAMVSLKILR